MSICSLLGILLNLTLLFLAIFKSPETIKAYSAILINVSVYNIISSITQFLTKARLIRLDNYIVVVSNGFCNASETTVCYTLFAFMLHAFSHVQWCTLLSFIFSYIVLRSGKIGWNTISLLLLLIYTPSVIQFIAFLLPSDHLNPHKIIGTTPLSSFAIFYTVFNMSVTPIPIIIAVFIIRFKCIQFLSENNQHLQEDTRKLHKQFIKSITFQAIYPTLFAVSGLIFLILQSYDRSAIVFEFSIFIIFALMPVISPLVYIVFIAPYRKTILTLTKCQKTK
ncbi:unnamed protein product [Caenorhabditis angaria]|uniref:G-protein coupled receptors family 1 profile domain-containing protein n=1 Tax=Caenorhabditis angaria TaxID=860376 RepID=A0A9P1MXX9_9PELO|nr:unnamed protein product [Caenorhabditis angaria]